MTNSPDSQHCQKVCCGWASQLPNLFDWSPRYTLISAPSRWWRSERKFSLVTKPSSWDTELDERKNHILFYTGDPRKVCPNRRLIWWEPWTSQKCANSYRAYECVPLYGNSLLWQTTQKTQTKENKDHLWEKMKLSRGHPCSRSCRGESFPGLLAMSASRHALLFLGSQLHLCLRGHLTSSSSVFSSVCPL